VSEGQVDSRWSRAPPHRTLQMLAIEGERAGRCLLSLRESKCCALAFVRTATRIRVANRPNAAVSHAPVVGPLPAQDVVGGDADRHRHARNRRAHRVRLALCDHVRCLVLKRGTLLFAAAHWAVVFLTRGSQTQQLHAKVLDCPLLIAAHMALVPYATAAFDARAACRTLHFSAVPGAHVQQRSLPAPAAFPRGRNGVRHLDCCTEHGLPAGNCLHTPPTH